MSNQKIDIIIIDDDIQFRQQMAKYFQDHYGLTVRHPQIWKYDRISEYLINNPSCVLLLDEFLGEKNGIPISALSLLKNIKRTNSFDKIKNKIWIITGNSSPAINKLQRITSNVQNKWLAKPTTFEQILLFIKSDGEEIEGIVPPDLDDNNTCYRIINDENEVIYTNNWNGPFNKPDPTHLSAGRNPNKIKSVTIEREFWGTCPLSGEVGAFTINQIPAKKKGFYIQSVVDSKSKPNDQRKFFIINFLRSLAEYGFPRGRYYDLRDVSGSQGTITLRYCNHKETTVPAPWQALNGSLLEVVKNFEGKDANDNKLIYSILPQNQLHDVDYFDKIIDSKGVQDWLLIPFLKKDSTTMTFKVKGLFVFDRKSIARPTKVETNTEKDTNIDDTQVQKIAPLFRPVFKDLRDLEEKNHRKDLMKRWERIRDALDALAPIQEAKYFFQTYVKLACEMSKAEKGILIVKWGQMPIVTIVAINEQVECLSFFEKCRLPEKSNCNFPFHWSDTVDGNPEKPFSGITIEDLTKVTKYGLGGDTNRDHLERGVECLNKIGSSITIPHKINEQTIACLILLHDEVYAFSEKLSSISRDFAAVVTPQLQFLISRYNKKMWQHSLVHEIGGCLWGAKTPIDVRAKHNPEEYSAPLMFLQHGHDLCQNFLDLHKNIRIDTSKKFLLHEAIDDCFKLYLPLSKGHKQNIHYCSRYKELGSISLHGKEYFYRILRVLIHNAIKFGGTEATIDVQIILNQKTAEVIINNPGQMSEEENQLKFQSHIIPRNKSGNVGAHVGLSFAKHLVEMCGGIVSVENTKNKRVQARVTWPLQLEVTSKTN
ncbi:MULTISPECIES: sensor histidine kinase [unclassified Maridesulfovibrio]|uniref:sensor histidine kinase n=1 Tax=unclassified Maridesulfovibrio TaxID=2794999 RepID=UPI003B3D1C82